MRALLIKYVYQTGKCIYVYRACFIYVLQDALWNNIVKLEQNRLKCWQYNNTNNRYPLGCLPRHFSLVWLEHMLMSANQLTLLSKLSPYCSVKGHLGPFTDLSNVRGAIIGKVVHRPTFEVQFGILNNFNKVVLFNSNENVKIFTHSAYTLKPLSTPVSTSIRE